MEILRRECHPIHWLTSKGCLEGNLWFGECWIYDSLVDPVKPAHPQVPTNQVIDLTSPPPSTLRDSQGRLLPQAQNLKRNVDNGIASRATATSVLERPAKVPRMGNLMPHVLPARTVPAGRAFQNSIAPLAQGFGMPQDELPPVRHFLYSRRGSFAEQIPSPSSHCQKA